MAARQNRVNRSLTRKARPYRDTDEITEATCRLIRAIGRRVAREDATDLLLLARLQDEVDEAVAVAIEGVRRNTTDVDIGRVLAGTSLLAGSTKQAVGQKWPRSA